MNYDKAQSKPITKPTATSRKTMRSSSRHEVLSFCLPYPVLTVSNALLFHWKIGAFPLRLPLFTLFILFLFIFFPCLCLQFWTDLSKLDGHRQGSRMLQCSFIYWPFLSLVYAVNLQKLQVHLGNSAHWRMKQAVPYSRQSY